MSEEIQKVSGNSVVHESTVQSTRGFNWVLAKPLVNRTAVVSGDSYSNSSPKKVASLRLLEEFRTLFQAVRLGINDQKLLTDLIFYARHPELSEAAIIVNQELLNERASITQLMILPVLSEASSTSADPGRRQGTSLAASAKRYNSHHFDDIVESAVRFCPGLSPSMLAGLLGQESNFNPRVINEYGYGGIAQLGRAEASELGLSIGAAGTSDERLDPNRAIPAAARLLNIKRQRLHEIAFSRYGEPPEAEMWKFVLAAYNGGEGTVALAMGNAYRTGLAQARARGAYGIDAVAFAKSYAGTWRNLISGGMSSSLGQATTRYFPQLAKAKYQEIGAFPLAVLKQSESWLR